MKPRKKIIRTSTVALSLDYLLKGQLAFLQKYYEVVAVSGDDDHLKTVAKREGVRTVALTMQRPIRPLKDLAALWKLYRLFKKEKPFIVHSITPKAGLLSMTAAYFAGVPVRIHSFTGLIFPSRKGILQKILIVMDKWLCRFATHIYPEGQGVKADLIHYKITKKPLHVIANGNINGIDTEYFNRDLFPSESNRNLKSELGISTDDFVFLFVGRLVKDKGINELVNAFQKFCAQEPNVKLLLVGPFESDLSPLQAETLKAIEDNDRIITVGFQPEVRQYYAISDALVFPSYREGFPNVVMQSGAMELPCIVTDINGSNEIIIHGENGLIIPSKDENAILQAMAKIKSDLALYQKLKKNARPMIVARFQQHKVWEAILNEYRTFDDSTKQNVHENH